MRRLRGVALSVLALADAGWMTASGNPGEDFLRPRDLMPSRRAPEPFPSQSKPAG